MDGQFDLSLIVPCCNDGEVLDACLESLLAQTLARLPGAMEIIVVLNGCVDDSLAVAARHAAVAHGIGCGFSVLELPRPSKSAALNAGDASASGNMRVYVDADVICSPDLLEVLRSTLDTPTPRYATGTIVVASARSWVTTAYGHFWKALILRDVNGIGLYAVNSAGRLRWAAFPAMFSDDKFVRLSFAPEERVRVVSRYVWPLPEGWRRLVSVRIRWTEGNLELKRLFPSMVRQQSRARRPWVYLGAALRDPVGFVVFTSVYVACWLLARPDISTEGTVWRRAR